MNIDRMWKFIIGIFHWLVFGSWKEYVNQVNRKGERHGLWREFWDGSICIECEYVNGIKHGLSRTYRSDNATSKYPGTLSTECTYVNGLKTGLQRTWHSNGSLWVESNMKNDRMDGAYKVWNNGGGLQWSSYYADNSLEGEVIVYKYEFDL